MSDTLMVSVSGVRGLVGTDLTPEVVARWAAAFGTWAKDGRPDGRTARRPVSIVIGRDARTSGPMFTSAAIAGLQSVGCHVIDVGLVATPSVQLAVEHHRAAGGIILTASHNPIEWNALKFVGPDGIFLDTGSGTRVRELAAGDSLPRAQVTAIGDVKSDPDAIARHLAAVLSLRGVDVRAIRRRRFRVAVDPDVDRLAIVDEKGRPIGEDYTLAFAIRAVRPSGRQTVVCNLSTSLVVEDAAREFGARVVRAAVGEAHVARKIIALKSLIGGEGNGGVMYPALHVGRDAPVALALVLSLLARERVTVSELVARAPRYTIVKAKLELGARSREPGKLDQVYAELRRRFPDAAADTQDGLRLAWPDRWLHVRPSGTEPIIRFIAEAPTSADAERL